jgi:transcriptional regulator with XRE-family HTH domain
MPRTKTPLLGSPPYPVDEALRRLGANLRAARLARNITAEEAAEKIGTGRRAVLDAEKGNPGTGAAVYLALLWTYDLLDPVKRLADPALDVVGLASGARRQRARARMPRELDNDF